MRAHLSACACGQAVDEAAHQRSVSLAELRLGQALAAEPEHADRDAYGAAKVRHISTIILLIISMSVGSSQSSAGQYASLVSARDAP